MNDKLNIKYLKDPRKIFGETENVYTVVRKGFTKDHPEIAKFFRQFKWKTSDLNSLSLICYGYDGDLEKGARESGTESRLPQRYKTGSRNQNQNGGYWILQ